MVFVDTVVVWMTQAPWAEIREHAKAYALPLAGVYVAQKFGRIQADIGRRQANTAAQAMNTARNKLRLDLFDKRLAVYQAAHEFITKAARGDRLNADHRLDLLRDIKGATWLFDERTARYLTDMLFTDAYEVVRISEALDHENDRKERRKLYDQRDTYCITFKRHDDRLHKLMEPYLRFTDRVELHDHET